MAYQLPPLQPPPMPANGGAGGGGGRQQLPSTAHVGHHHQHGQPQQQMMNSRQQQITPNAMAASVQPNQQRGPAQPQSRMVQSVGPTKAAKGGGNNGSHANAAVTPVSALTLLQRKRRRYDSSSSSMAATTAGNNSNIGHLAADASRDSGAPAIRLPPPLYLLLPPPQSSPDNSNISNSSRHQQQHQPLAASASAANLTASRGVFEIGQGITEISGEAGSGKTQLCLRLCVSCALSAYSVDGGDDGRYGGDNDIGVGQQRQQQQMAMPPPPPVAATNVYNPYTNSFHVQRVQPRPAAPQQNPHVQQQQVGNRTRQQYYRAVYVTMGEGLSPSQIAYRLGQMATASTTTSSASTLAPSGQNNSTAILNRILTRSVRNEDELLDLVRRELPSMLRRGWGDDDRNTHSGSSSPSTAEGRIGLVVLDSIAGMFRLPDAAKDKGTAFFARRSEILFGLSAQLRKLGDEYGVAFVVANQVTAGKAASGGGPRIMGGGGGGGGNIKPALGLSWSNCINTRFVLRRSETLSSRMGVSSAVRGSGGSNGITNANGNQQQNQQAQAPVSMFKRWARVTKSPVLPPVSVPFAIDVRGGAATENPK